jgi:hypothetical protein
LARWRITTAVWVGLKHRFGSLEQWNETVKRSRHPVSCLPACILLFCVVRRVPFDICAALTDGIMWGREGDAVSMPYRCRIDAVLVHLFIRRTSVVLCEYAPLPSLEHAVGTTTYATSS